MPKRIVDGDGVWRSDKLARVHPQEWRAEYANMLPLAQANGSFEVNSRRVWSAVYSYNRSGLTQENVEAILAEFERVRLLFRWFTADGKEWGYWTGIDKPGRLPPPSRKNRRHEAVGAEPPRELLQQFLTVEKVGVERMANHEVATGQPMDSHTVADGCLGLGLGLGLGETLSSKPDGSDHHREEDFQLTDLEAGRQTAWEYYLVQLGRNPKLYTWTKERKQMGLARLRDLSKRAGSVAKGVDAMKICIDRLRESRFHNGDNKQKKKYLGWEILFRSTEQMEKWLDDANFGGASGS